MILHNDYTDVKNEKSLLSLIINNSVLSRSQECLQTIKTNGVKKNLK